MYLAKWSLKSFNDKGVLWFELSGDFSMNDAGKFVEAFDAYAGWQKWTVCGDISGIENVDEGVTVLLSSLAKLYRPQIRRVHIISDKLVVRMGLRAFLGIRGVKYSVYPSRESLVNSFWEKGVGLPLEPPL